LSRPFDAAEIYLRESDSRDMELWSPVSLLYEVRKSLAEPPPNNEEDAEERRVRISRCLDILGERGIDFETHIRAPFARSLGAVIGVIAVVGSMVEFDDDSRLAYFGQHWRDLLGVTDEVSLDDASDSAAQIVGSLSTTLTWAFTAPVEELISWLPANGELPSPDPGILGRLSESDHWLVDRFLTTYLDRWEESSLHAEWEWIHGRRQSPIPLSSMRARKLDPGRIAIQIADLATSEEPRRSSTNTMAMAQYQVLAGRLLDDGRRDAAVGVFEGVIAVDPDDADAHNNKGFCLLPDDPAAALESLERARDLDYEPQIVNVANRVTALVRLGRLAAANELADGGYTRFHDSQPVRAALWDLDSLGADPTIVHVSDTTDFVAGLGIHIACAVEDETLEERWAARKSVRAEFLAKD
jgi:hypothetical protein